MVGGTKPTSNQGDKTRFLVGARNAATPPRPTTLCQHQPNCLLSQPFDADVGQVVRPERETCQPGIEQTRTEHTRATAQRATPTGEPTEFGLLSTGSPYSAGCDVRICRNPPARTRASFRRDYAGNPAFQLVSRL